MKSLRAGGLIAIALGLVVLAQAAVPAARDKAKPPPTPALPAPTIAGLEIPRPQGTFLGLELVNNRFVLSFYDATKQKVAPDAARATLRWPVKYQPSDERTVLNLGGDGTSLTSAKAIRPPHNFRLSISLFVEGHEDAVESYNVVFAK